MSETEMKYEVPRTVAAALDAALRRLGGRRSRVESHYFDTAAGDLAAAGLSLRLRRSRGGWEQTLKAPGRHALDRLEETAPRPGRWGRQAPFLDLALHRGSRAGAALDDVMQRAAPDARLLPIHRSRVERRAAAIESGGALIEVALDRGVIVAGQATQPICELELELKSGDAAALVPIARAGVAAYGLWLSTLSKAARGDALARHGGRFTAGKAHEPSLRRSASGGELARSMLGACFAQVGANVSILAGGQGDDEVIHQLRVGLRRIRTAGRELGRAAGSGTPPWESAFASTFRALGEHRDRRTLAASLGAELARAGAPAPMQAADADGDDPVALVRAPAFQQALIDVLAVVMPAAAADAGAPAKVARAALERRLTILMRSLRRGAKRFAAMDDAGRHDVRKRLKRLRYLVELVGSLYDERQVARFVDALRPAQDALGSYADTVVGIRLSRERAEAGQAEAWFDAGWLTGRLGKRAKACERALRQAAAAKPFWSEAAP